MAAMTTNAEIKIPEEVRQALNDAVWGSDHVVLSGKLDRKTYVAVDKVLRAAGLIWNRARKCHCGSEAAVAALDRAASGAEAIVDKKRALQQFFTPPDVAQALVDLIPPFSTEMVSVLEPSAGHGALIDALLFASLNPERYQICAVDSCAENASVLRQKYLDGVDVDEIDFMIRQSDVHYDLVIMNPPWTKSQDVDHVTKAWGNVKPGGFLAAIVSPNALEKKTKKYLRFQELHEEHAIDWLHIPKGSFKSSGTDVAALAVVWKRGNE